jgi:hypothetical protein
MNMATQIRLVAKGDAPGHEFHGNQYQGGSGKIMHDDVKQVAENMAIQLRNSGFHVDVQHSGSIAGASSYLTLRHDETGRNITDQIRVSDHDKGTFNSQFYYHVTSHEDVPKVVTQMQGLLQQMKQSGLASGLKQSPETEARIMRLRAKNEARRSRQTNKVNLRSLLFKEDGGGAASTTTTGHVQSSSATSGITAYGMIRNTLRRKLKRKEKQDG